MRAAAAVQRAAERATLDRNDYSGARISQEASSVLSPGAIALVNGRTAHSPAELQAQLSGAHITLLALLPPSLRCACCAYLITKFLH